MRGLVVALIVGLFVLSVVVRLLPPVPEEAISSTLDGFYYLRQARLLKEGVYRSGTPDPLRNYPDGGTHGEPSFLSEVIAFSSKLTGLSVDKVPRELRLIPVLGSLVVIPLFLMGFSTGGVLCGTAAAIACAFSPVYVGRTNLLRVDTDCLNVFFPFMLAFFLSLSLRSDRWRGFLCVAFAAITAHLWNWWYLHPGLILPFVVCYLVAVAFFGGRRALQERLGLAGIFLAALGPVLVDSVSHMAGMLGGIYSPLAATASPGPESVVPGRQVLFQTVSELRVPSLETVLLQMAVHPVIACMGLAGLLPLFWCNRREAVLLLPILLLGLMSFKKGVRFLIYLAPFVGLGFGYLVALAVDRLQLPGLRVACRLLAVALIFFTFFRPESLTAAHPRVKVSPEVIRGLEWLRNQSPADSVVWSWWDWGYPIAHIARRATVNDGGGYKNRKTAAVARSFLSTEPERALHLIFSTLSLDEARFEALKSTGVSEREIFREMEQGHLAKREVPPVYVLVTGYDLAYQPGMCLYGRLLGEELCRHRFASLDHCRFAPDGWHCAENLVVSLDRGQLCQEDPLGRFCASVSRVTLTVLDQEDRILHRRELVRREGKGYVVDLFLKQGNFFGIAAAQPLSRTLLYRLIVPGEEPEEFVPVYSRLPYVRILMVKGGEES